MELIPLLQLIVFVVWISVVMYLAADPRIPAFNREFTAVIITTACLFYSLVPAELFTTVVLAYLGIRTYQKKVNHENGKGNNP